uniref:Variant surface glycoprotein n=1 Tax=Trypanosoma brucei TaxID=5691 RepID=A0A1V0FY01_9TRYP|nr:variant surface glycoprotein [Trypanosoma brucei]
MHHFQLQLPYVEILLMVATQPIATNKDSTTVKAACHEVAFNDKLAAAFKQKIDGLAAKKSQLLKEAEALDAAACLATDHKTKKATRMLASIGSSRAAATEANADAVKQLKASIETLKRRNAQLMAAIAFNTKGDLTISHDASAQKSDLIGGAGAKSCSVTITQPPKNEHGCQSSLVNDPAINDDVNNVQNLDSYQAIHDKAFQLTDIAADIGNKGDYGSATPATHNKKIACVDTGDRSNKLGSVAKGIILTNFARKADWNTPTKNTIKSKGDGTDCEDDQDSDKKAFVTAKAAGYAICNGRRQTVTEPETLSQLTMDALKEQKDVQEAAMLITAGPTAELPDTDKQKEAVVALVGEGKTTVHDKFLKDMEANKLDFKIGSKHVNKGIASISVTEDYARPIGFCLGDQYRKEKAQKKVESVTAATPEKNKEYKGETDEGKCNNKDGCEFKDGKCEAKVTTTKTQTLPEAILLSLTRPLFGLQFCF